MRVNKAFLTIVGLLFVITSLYGGYLNYSPIPFWDMWDGYFGFYQEIQKGNWEAWFAQHNEHRYVLARLLFWVDIHYLKGLSILLIILNYLTIVTSIILFYKFSALDERHTSTVQLVFILSFLLLLIQGENLYWGFQIGFLLAAVLPLAALYFANKSMISSRNSLFYFILSLMLGVMSVGTLASGVIVLPLLLIFGVLTRQSIVKNSVILLLAALSIALYYFDYSSPGNHGSLLAALINKPVEFLRYILVYMGGPFYYIFGRGALGLLFSQIMGAAFVLNFIYVVWLEYRKNRINKLPSGDGGRSGVALLLFVFYILCIAVGTAGGRLIFGVEQSLSSRYMTMSLMAWVALLIATTPYLSERSNKILKNILALILLLMMPVQFNSLKLDHKTMHERSVAILALKLGINDQDQILNIYPHAQRALDLAKYFEAKNRSIFGVAPYKDLSEKMGGRLNLDLDKMHECSGGVDSIQQVAGDPNYFKIDGWISNSEKRLGHEFVNVVDENGKIIGVLVGSGRETRIKGYFIDAFVSQGRYLVPNSLNCYLKFDIPKKIVDFSKPNYVDGLISMAHLNKINKNEWRGVDYYSYEQGVNVLHGFKVIGSYSGLDPNAGEQGELIVKMKKGEAVLYRSEPKANLQKISITLDGLEKQLPRPTTSEWILIRFVDKDLPESFNVKFTDGGGGWGEWSAVALSTN